MTNEVVKAVVVEAGNPEIAIVEKFDCSLEATQEFLGGWLEAIRITDSIVMWCNEEGKLQKLPPNFALVSSNGKLYDTMVGNIFFTGVDRDGETVSLTDNEIKELQQRFIKRWEFIFRD